MCQDQDTEQSKQNFSCKRTRVPHTCTVYTHVNSTHQYKLPDTCSTSLWKTPANLGISFFWQSGKVSCVGMEPLMRDGLAASGALTLRRNAALLCPSACIPNTLTLRRNAALLCPSACIPNTLPRYDPALQVMKAAQHLFAITPVLYKPSS